MADEYAPNFYHAMLKLPEDTASPDHYELLSLERFETDETQIRERSIDANQKLLAWQNSQYHVECNHLMDEVVQARAVLLDPRRKARYDEDLRRRLRMGNPGNAEAPATSTRPSRTSDETTPISRERLFTGLGGLATILVVAVTMVTLRSPNKERTSEEIEASHEVQTTESPSGQEEDSETDRTDTRVASAAAHESAPVPAVSATESGIEVDLPALPEVDLLASPTEVTNSS